MQETPSQGIVSAFKYGNMMLIWKQCDNTEPSCQKCIKIGKKCPGYLDEWDLAQRNENSLIASKVHGKLLVRSPVSTFSSDLDKWVMKVFIHDYVLETHGKFGGWFSFLPTMIQQADGDSILRLSVCAAAYANFFQKSKRKDVEILAIAAYNRALNLAGTVLTSRGVPEEATLTAIFLLGLYEVSRVDLSSHTTLTI